jgi:hypothetical protein
VPPSRLAGYGEDSLPTDGIVHRKRQRRALNRVVRGSVAADQRGTRNLNVIRASAAVEDDGLADVVESHLPARAAIVGGHNERPINPGRKFTYRLPKVGNVNLGVRSSSRVRVGNDDVRDEICRGRGTDAENQLCRASGIMRSEKTTRASLLFWTPEHGISLRHRIHRRHLAAL